MMVKKAIKKAKDEMQNPGWVSLSLIGIAMILGFSEWVTQSGLEKAREILELQNMASLLKYLSPTATAALLRGFVK